MKIVIKFKKQMEVIEEKEIEVNLPAYREYAGAAVILSPERIIYLTDGNLQEGGEDMVNLYLKDGDTISSACFNNAFQKALTKWNNLDREMKSSNEIYQEHIWEQSHELTDDNKDRRRDEEMVEKYGHEAKEFEL